MANEGNTKARDLPYLSSAGNYIDAPKQMSNSSELPMLRKKQTVLARDAIDQKNEMQK
jgi:hypothetical protein